MGPETFTPINSRESEIKSHNVQIRRLVLICPVQGGIYFLDQSHTLVTLVSRCIPEIHVHSFPESLTGIAEQNLLDVGFTLKWCCFSFLVHSQLVS